MPYKELLNNLIEQSGLSINEIADRCNIHNHVVTASYISLLCNKKNNRIPTEDVSRAIAIACNAKYDNVLVVEGFIDKAPEEIVSILNMVRDSTINATLCIYNKQTAEEYKQNYQNLFFDQPFAEFIIEAARQAEFEIAKTQETITQIGNFEDDEIISPIQLNKAIDLPIKDDSMTPILPNGCKTTLEVKNIMDYEDGDILCFTKREGKEIKYRKCAFSDVKHKKVSLFPTNNKYPSEVHYISEIVILGKVKQCITDF